MNEFEPTGQIAACQWCGGALCFGECSPGRIAEPLVLAEDVQRGAACPRCDRYFQEGERYSTLLIGFMHDVPITEVVCERCMLAGASGGG